MKITFTSSDRLWNVCTGRSSEVEVAELADPDATAFAVGDAVCPGAGDCAVGGVVCAKAEQQTKMSANNSARGVLKGISGLLSNIIVCEK